MSRYFYRVSSEVPPPGVDDSWPVFVPTAAILVTVVSKEGRPNIIPLTGWGVLCRFPFQIGIAICQGDYTKNYFRRKSYEMLLETGEFVVNIPHVGLRDAITVCGEHSAHDPKVDKFKLAGLTPGSSVVVKPPIIEECPVNLECIVRHRIPLGSHDVFVGEVVASHMYGRPVKTDVIEEENVWVLQPEDGGPKMKLYWKTLMDFSPAE
ncbi:MAG TPA: flavin reductase family protein [Firmicutes bacterium]|nr:flavin reductase family protein [Bacillota bacterium]